MVIVCYVLRADVARLLSADIGMFQAGDLPLHIPTVRACHLVAAKFLDERMLTFVAVSYQGCRHRFFDNVSQGNLAILLRFLAAEWDVRLLFAKATTRLAAFGVLTAELLVNLNR